MGPPGGPKNGAADLYFFWLSKKKLCSDMGVGGSVDEAQLCGSLLFCVKLQRKKVENTRLKGEFAGLKMGPSGGPVFGAAVSGKREK